MLPSSHVVPIKLSGPIPLDNPRLLADAFSEFIAASAQLEASYRNLQQEVSHLSGELAERNAALTRSLAENSRMRAALQQIIDSMPCGVLVLDPSETILIINPEARRLLGLLNQHVVSLAVLSQLSGLDFEMLGGMDRIERDTEVRHTVMGSERWLALGRHLLQVAGGAQDSFGSRLGSIWILRDVTAEKRAEREREAVRRAATLAEISAILAHEIRNPLASLELFAGLIADGDANSEQWIAHLQAGIRTLSGTVNNVLSLNGETSPRLVVLDLVQASRNSVAFVQPIAAQARVALTFSSAEDSLSIHGNEDALRQIILNLASNAIRHTQPGSRVDVSVRREERDGKPLAVVTVSDSGCGIREEQLAHLFEAGFSGTGETPGLGLAVCRRLMSRHGGSISASSRFGEGSTFQMEFPAL